MFAKDRDKKIVEMYVEDKKTSREIGYIYGITHERVLQILKQEGVSIRATGQRELCAEVVKNIAQDYKDGVLLSVIRKRYGVTRDKIDIALKEVYTAEEIEAINKNVFRTQVAEFKTEILEDIKQIGNLTAVAEKYNVNYITLHRYLTSIGVDTSEISRGINAVQKRVQMEKIQERLQAQELTLKDLYTEYAGDVSKLANYFEVSSYTVNIALIKHGVYQDIINKVVTKEILLDIYNECDKDIKRLSQCLKEDYNLSISVIFLYAILSLEGIIESEETDVYKIIKEYRELKHYK